MFAQQGGAKHPIHKGSCQVLKHNHAAAHHLICIDVTQKIECGAVLVHCAGCSSSLRNLESMPRQEFPHVAAMIAQLGCAEHNIHGAGFRCRGQSQGS